MFDTQLLYFIRKLVILIILGHTLIILDRENVVFVSFCAV